MNLGECYRLLELNSAASLAEIKASYRRLIRQYHPDLNPTDEKSQHKFIALTEAYKLLLSAVQSQPTNLDANNPEQAKVTVETSSPEIKVTRKEKPTPATPHLSDTEELVKWNCYQEFQQLLKHKKFPKAIALIEGLIQRLPQDPQVRSWYAIAYQRWGRQLIDEKQPDKARIYLKKALKIDPHNRSLWSEVERDFRRLEKIF